MCIRDSYTTVALAAGETFSGALPYSVRPEGEEGDFGANVVYTEEVFMGVVAAKVVTAREGYGVDGAEGEGTGVLDLASVVDLTDTVVEGEDGYTLEWTAPDDGDYALFVYWMHGTGQTSEPSVSKNYTVNYMDSYGIEALIDYWEENILTEDLREVLQASGRGEIYMDSLEVSTYGAGGLFWGYNFKDEFEARMGYDITPYLPFICAADGLSLIHI